MSDRREFLRLGLWGTAALAAGCSPQETSPEKKAPAPPGRGPVILSTWDHGEVANVEALRVLRSGGSTLDAVESGVAIVESDFSNRSVGLGGNPDRDGRVTLDACIQDNDGRAGGVAALERIENPIRVARAVMERTPHVLLVGEGAQRWALDNGFALKDVSIPEVQEAYQEWLKTSRYKPVANIENHDTIGLIAMDAQGLMAGSCTTSGMAYKMHGRVGDSPIIGAGLFVDGEVGAACATGVGELVIRMAGSSIVVELMRHGATPEEACKEAIHRIVRKNPGLEEQQVGFLALRKDGLHGAWGLYEGFTYALTTPDGGTAVRSSGFERKWKRA
ncbi:MAG TPA: N(4)-(beta-N-acetylglucosaminyl)-L-asparaginase [Flavobacteriales bacterium]